jgi:plasmid stabilization system protein ParE
MTRIDFVTGNATIYLPDVEALAAVPDLLEEALTGRRSEELQRKPEGGRSALRIAGDMIAHARWDAEALHRMAWMTDPVIRRLDLEADAAEHGWESRDAARLVEWFTDAIREAVDELKDQPDAAWGRPGLFPERRSIRQEARRAVAYYSQELAAIRAVLGG